MSADNQRKRKRASDPSARPSKRPANPSSASSSSKLPVRHLSCQDQWKPVIATATGISIPPKISFDAYVKQNESTTGDQLLLHSSKHPRLDYSARMHMNSSSHGLLKHYVAVFDPPTGQVHVVEAHKLDMKTSVRSEDEEMRTKSRLDPPSNLSKRQDLGMTFGTKKARKAIESLSQNAISPRAPRGATQESVRRSIKGNPSAKAVLDSMAGSADNAPTLEQMQIEAEVEKPRPLYNLDAKDPGEAYIPDDVVGRYCMQGITVEDWHPWDEKEREQRIQKGVKTRSFFARNRVVPLIQSSDMTRLKCLKYYLLLLEYLANLIAGGKDASRLRKGADLRSGVNVQPNVIESMQTTFSLQGEVNQWYKNKIILHMLAITLIVDDGLTDTHDVQQDLRLSSAVVTKYYAELGAKCTTMREAERMRARLTKTEASQHKIARVHLPLEFPKPKRGAR